MTVLGVGCSAGDFVGVLCRLHNTLRELDVPKPELCCDAASLAVAADEDDADASDKSVVAAGGMVGYVFGVSALLLDSIPDRTAVASDQLWSPGR